MLNSDRADAILTYWFGRVEGSTLPSKNRTHIWFGGDKDVDEEIRENFADDLEKATGGAYTPWEDEARLCLTLIILFDQFSRNVFRGSGRAFENDQTALDLCLKGIEKQYDHDLSLIERAFFYMPLMHSEDLEMQTTSVRAFKILVDLSFPETRSMFQNFLDFALKHYEVIKDFGRFPTRNELLGRVSMDAELDYLKRFEQEGW